MLNRFSLNVLSFDLNKGDLWPMNKTTDTVLLLNCALNDYFHQQNRYRPPSFQIFLLWFYTYIFRYSTMRTLISHGVSNEIYSHTILWALAFTFKAALWPLHCWWNNTKDVLTSVYSMFRLRFRARHFVERAHTKILRIIADHKNHTWEFFYACVRVYASGSFVIRLQCDFGKKGAQKVYSWILSFLSSAVHGRWCKNSKDFSVGPECPLCINQFILSKFIMLFRY